MYHSGTHLPTPRPCENAQYSAKQFRVAGVRTAPVRHGSHRTAPPRSHPGAQPGCLPWAMPRRLEVPTVPALSASHRRPPRPETEARSFYHRVGAPPEETAKGASE